MHPPNIGRYQIRSEIGRGGMATVYHAYDPHFQRDVALKVLPPQFTHDPTFRTRFIREAQMIASLEHPAIVSVYDFGEEENQPYLVMRYLPGGSLAERLERGSLSIEETIRILTRVASALDEAHRQGIVHRDLKPDNILFDQNDFPFITDFGIAKLTEESGGLTTTGIIVGTPAYMSPEQASGMELDGRSDVYALGVILFQMLTGQLPFDANTPVALIMKHMTKPVPPILDLNPDLPYTYEEVIIKALAKDRDERFGTAMELAAALSAANQIDQEEHRAQRVATPLKPLSSRSEQPPPEGKLATPVSPARSGPPVICPNCDTANKEELTVCTTCGMRLKTECPVCFQANRIDAAHCSNCGTDLKRSLAMRRKLEDERKRKLAERDMAYKHKAARQFRRKIPQLLDDLNNRKTRSRAFSQLNQIIEQAVYVLIESLLTDSDPGDRLESARVLRRLCERREVATEIKTNITNAFIEVLEEPDSEVRKEVQQALEKIGRRRPREISDIFTSLVDWLKGE